MMKLQHGLAAVLLVVVCSAGVSHSIPATPQFFKVQLVDHFSAETSTYTQRYYMDDTHFKGPGAPIFVIVGGEGAIEPSTGLYYPFVVDLAREHGALVVEPENRFYGTSLPVQPWSSDHLHLLTPQQVLADIAHFVVSLRAQYGCAPTDDKRCPVMTFGGSYPGWLSAMMRLRYPAVVDFAYAASAPVLFYNQQVDQYDYYRTVTQSAEVSSPGCAAAVQAMLHRTIRSASKDEIVHKLGLCTDLPAYLHDGGARLLMDEINMVVMYTFATLNMGNYPPPATALQASCKQIQSAVSEDRHWEALSTFLGAFMVPAMQWRSQSARDMSLTSYIAAADASYTALRGPKSCLDLHTQLPAGHNATISSGDWSGVGTGQNGANWDFETCTFLVEAIGANGSSDMFLPRKWSLDWLNKHCATRFGVVPSPRTLADEWGTDHLDDVTSHIIFTNGLTDGWSVGGVMQGNAGKDIHVLNMEDGAHHSDLGHSPPGPQDTPSVQKVHAEVRRLLKRWLA